MAKTKGSTAAAATTAEPTNGSEPGPGESEPENAALESLLAPDDAWPTEFTPDVMNRLLQPFPEDEIKFLPKNPRNGKALALAYIEQRAVQRRLDEVVGPGNWSFDYEVLDPPVCSKLKAKLTVFGVTKTDAGQAGKEEEVLKSAVSDGMKRAAVHFGIGRYLYYLGSIWADYDDARKSWASHPKIDAKRYANACRICGYKGDKDGRINVRPRTLELDPAPPPAALPGTAPAPPPRASVTETRQSVAPTESERPGVIAKETMTRIAEAVSASGLRKEVGERIADYLGLDRISLPRLPAWVEVEGAWVEIEAFFLGVIESERRRAAARAAAPKPEASE